MRTLVVGDIHGAHKALVQVLQRAEFDAETDRLICLGDVCDGWPETFECIETLCVYQKLMEERFIFILGNHDEWALQWMRTAAAEHAWVCQGGRATQDSYIRAGGMPAHHIQFLARAELAYVDEERNYLFVHAGIEPGIDLKDQARDVLLWDRDLWHWYSKQPDCRTGYEKVFIGHTSQKGGPFRQHEVWNLDTGAGWSGYLTVMDADTQEYWQSDLVKDLYPEVEGR